MAELLTQKNSDLLWSLKKSKYPGIKDLHIHQHSAGLTLTATLTNGIKEHLNVDKYQTVEDFGETLDYFYRKLVQKYGL